MKLSLDRIFYSNLKIRVLLHLLFWVLYILFFLGHFSSYEVQPNYKRIFVLILSTLWIVIVESYFLFYFLFPKYFFKKKYIGFILLFILSYVITIFSYRLVYYFFYLPVFYPQFLAKTTFWKIYPLSITLSVYSGVGLFGTIKLIKFWFIENKKRFELENQKKADEILMLRNQLNPHFLFNTLNNIDVLILKDQQRASEAVITLSDILRYMLYEAKSEYVTIKQEIHYINNFIHLQKLRLANKESIIFQLNAENEEKDIAPLLFIPFIENAFKHGIKNDLEKPILISLLSDYKMLKLSVSNHYMPENNFIKDVASGIGLKNVQRRLELIYPTNHELEISNSQMVFDVKLTIFH